jgi:subtilase family serine protease
MHHSAMGRTALIVRALVGAFFIFALCSNALGQKLQPLGLAPANQEVQFEVYLPLQHAAELDQLLSAMQTPGSPEYHRWLTPQQFKSRFGAKPDDLARAADALRSYGLTVTNTHTQGFYAQGPVSKVEAAFNAPISMAAAPNGRQTMISTQPLSLPPALASVGAQVFNFSPVIRHRVHAVRGSAVPDNRTSPVGGYWFDDLKQAYTFPSFQRLTGKGRKIGIVIPSDFLRSDITAYFSHEKLVKPTVLVRPVLGGAKFDPNSAASFEAELDIEQSGGMAPGATIVVYNIPDLSDPSILAGYTAIVEDNAVDIVNSSFGGPEGFYTAAYNNGTDFTGVLRTYEQLFKQGNAQGITFVASSGDFGGLGLPSLSYFTTPPKNPPVVAGKFLPGIETPASSPSVTAVGGTNLVTTFQPPSLNSAYVRENAFGDPLVPFDPFGLGNLVSGGFWGSGGGHSVVFVKPDYQKLVNTGSDHRAIPDVSLHMGGCPGGISKFPCGNDRSFDIEVFAGQVFGVIGTSASSPDFAGLLALEEERQGGVRLGNVNHQIYTLAAAQFSGKLSPPVYHQGIPGFNGYFTTHAGYNQVLGNGTVFGKNFILAPNLPSAGIPRTPSNP